MTGLMTILYLYLRAWVDLGFISPGHIQTSFSSVTSLVELKVFLILATFKFATLHELGVSKP